MNDKLPQIVFNEKTRVLWFGYHIDRELKKSKAGHSIIEDKEWNDENKRPVPAYHEVENLDFLVMELNKVILIKQSDKDKAEKEEIKAPDE